MQNKRVILMHLYWACNLNMLICLAAGPTPGAAVMENQSIMLKWDVKEVKKVDPLWR